MIPLCSRLSAATAAERPFYAHYLRCQAGGYTLIEKYQVWAKYRKRVLVLEKHSIPGGLVTSFARKGVHFDLGLHGLYELNDGQAIPQFLQFWNAPQVETVPLCGDLKCYIDGNEYGFRHADIRQSFLDQLPENSKDVNRIFDLLEHIYTEMLSGSSAPEPPYDMNILELIQFGMTAKRQRPTFMKYGNRDTYQILDSLTACAQLKTAIYSRCPYPMVFMSFAYQWGVYGHSRYPVHGMQAIPNAAAEGFACMGGELKLNTEVAEILVRGGRAYGVRTTDGSEYHGAVISNASPHFTFGWISNGVSQKSKLIKTLRKRKMFDPVAALFLSLDESKYCLDHLEAISILSKEDYRASTGEYTAETAPIVINIYPQRAGDTYRALIALVPLSFQYQDSWNTEEGNGRGERYQKLKAETTRILLNRIGNHMGKDFIDAISYYELSTPVTYERYTYSKNGSFMGWSVEQSEYGKYMKQKTDLQDLYLVGQWVFPGFGVAGVMASGYYLAKDILRAEGIDLKKDFTDFFSEIG